MKEMQMWWLELIPGFKPLGVLHIGAETGGERFIYEDAGLAVVWVEGRLEAFQELQKNISPFPRQSAHHLTVTAIDHQPVIFRILDKKDSSTVLSLTDLHDHHYGFKMEEERPVNGRRIDEYFNEFPEPLLAKCNLLVIDIQGAELLALESMGELINNFQVAKIEISVFTPYIGGATLKSIDDFMVERLFVRRSMTLGGLSGDAIYVSVDRVTTASKAQMWVSRNWSTILRTRIFRRLARFLRRDIYLRFFQSTIVSPFLYENTVGRVNNS